MSLCVICWLGNDAGPAVDMWNLRLQDFRRMQYVGFLAKPQFTLRMLIIASVVSYRLDNIWYFHILHKSVHPSPDRGHLCAFQKE